MLEDWYLPSIYWKRRRITCAKAKEERSPRSKIITRSLLLKDHRLDQYLQRQIEFIC
jgi:hypothetical protein